MPSEMAAPMLCGGVTVYSPIKEQGAGPGKTVGIVGIGGLGHFGLIFAKALGAEVVAISHTEGKRADAEKMGASKFIATSQGKSVFKENARTMDFIGIESLGWMVLTYSVYSEYSRHAYLGISDYAQGWRKTHPRWCSGTTSSSYACFPLHLEQCLYRRIRDRKSRNDH